MRRQASVSRPAPRYPGQRDVHVDGHDVLAPADRSGAGAGGGAVMDFYEVLDQVVDLLRRRRRVTYRALKVQFQLDDAALEALKEELLKAQRLAVDEAGEVLVWSSDAATAPEPSPAAFQPVQPPATAAGQRPHAAPPPAAFHTPDAERRQLTVLFCDLVDSTKLSGQLDPEDLREVIRAYQASSAEVIDRFEGHIAQYLGDGLLVYFGYPRAHEDDAQRAVRAGREIVTAIGALNARLEREKRIRLAVRVGIHTGLVVVGEIGTTGRREQLALGETPNIAARIQGLAGSNTVIVSAATWRLVHGYFVSRDLGAHVLKGVGTAVGLHEIRGASGAQTRLDIAGTRGLTPLVGRDPEVTMLLERWHQAKTGLGQAVVLIGEAGIGKSRLVLVLKERLAGEPHLDWECRCSPYRENSALYPIIDLLHRLFQWQPADAVEAKLDKMEEALHQYRLPLTESVP